MQVIYLYHHDHDRCVCRQLLPLPQHPPEARQRAAVQGEQVPAALQPQDLPGNTVLYCIVL